MLGGPTKFDVHSEYLTLDVPPENGTGFVATSIAT